MTTRNYFYKGWFIKFGFKADNHDLIMFQGLPNKYGKMRESWDKSEEHYRKVKELQKQHGNKNRN